MGDEYILFVGRGNGEKTISPQLLLEKSGFRSKECDNGTVYYYSKENRLLIIHTDSAGKYLEFLCPPQNRYLLDEHINWVVTGDQESEREIFKLYTSCLQTGLDAQLIHNKDGKLETIE